MKKGFTLIELLAVIVILAIIALIATPIILNIINDSKEESNKRSVELYGKAVEQAIAKSQLNGSEIPSGDYTTTDGKTLTKDNISFEVEYSGSAVTCTTNKLYEDGSIYLSGCTVNGTEVEYTYGTRQQLEPGAYDNNNNLVADWDTLVNVYGLKLTENYGNSNAPIFRNDALKNVTKLVIPEGVTIIEEFVFSGCTNLKSIIIPDSVTNIGTSAFSDCTSLTNVTIPDSVTSIGQYAFRGCTSLTDVTISDSVTSIGQYAFGGCTNLKSIIIPDSVTNISEGVFEGCNDLTNVIIPDSVTNIGFRAFQGCTSLTNITIPDSVTSIDSLTFFGCTSLTDITIGSGVTSIYYGAFRGCTSLTNATFNNPNGWTLDNGTSLNLTDPTTNATYLKDTYKDNKWNRS